MKKLKVWGKSNYIHNVWATGENKSHKSKVLKWCPMDTEELYQIPFGSIHYDVFLLDIETGNLEQFHQ